MPIKQKRATSPGVRFQIVDTYEDLTKFSPEKNLIEPLKKNGGRGFMGRVSMRHRGGGSRQMYRLIDFKRNKDNMSAKVLAFEYDPNRNARIALLEYEDKERRYILAPLNLKIGDLVESGDEAEVRVGNSVPLKNIPIGTFVHNVEMQRGRGGQIVAKGGVHPEAVVRPHHDVAGDSGPWVGHGGRTTAYGEDRTRSRRTWSGRGTWRRRWRRLVGGCRGR